MLSSLIVLLLNSAFLSLRLGGNSGSFPRPLSAEEESRFLTLAAAGDEEARAVLIERNLRLVAHIVKKYYSADDADDLISIGTIGLIKGINTYRADKNVRLATYASRCIENEILMYFRSQRKSAGDLSLSDALDVDGEGNGLFVMDVLAQEDDMEERIGSRELCRSLRALIDSSLDSREAQIIRLRYGLDGREPMTQWETARECGISRSYVSRLEKRALEKLRRALEEP